MADLTALGYFDEEECRFFLREVGARVVPNYPFSYGMEEVHSLIVEEYGKDGIPDVTSLLHELLEEDSTSSGIGDDGDIWRSWRYHWRHRNDNALDPFVAKIGSFLLDLPTPRVVRRIKADNFLRKLVDVQSRQLPATPSPQSRRLPSPTIVEQESRTTSQKPFEEEVAADHQVLLTSATYSHQRCRLMLPTKPQDEDEVLSQPGQLIVSTSAVGSVTSGSDSQQDFAEVTSSLLESDFEPSLLLSFEMLEPGTLIRPEDPGLSAGHVPIYTLRPINSKPREVSSCTDDDKEKHHQQSKVGQLVGDKHSASDHSKAEYPESEKSSDQNDTSEAEGRPCTPGTIPEETFRSHHQGNASCVTPSETPEPQRKRIAHRHARLIDGAIFPFKARKSNATRGSVDVLEQLSPDAGRRSLFRLSWTPTRQNSDSRRSWLQGFKALFRSSQNNPAKTASGHRHKSSIGAIADAQPSMLTPHKRVVSNNTNTAKQSKPLGLSLDGAFDDLSSPSTSPLNKPLPLTPYEIAHSLSSGSRSASHGRSQSLLNQPHSASTASTQLSNKYGKSEFQALAQDLSGSKNCAMHFPELSPVHETRLDPRKYDPLKLPKPPTSPASFSSLAQRNPFTEFIEPITPKPRKSIDAQRYPDSRSSANYGLPPSQSEPNFQSSSPIKAASAVYYTPPNLPQTPPASSPERARSGTESPRGRSQSRGAVREQGKNKPLDGGGSPSKQVKRSRSPVKRLLGIGKNTPTKEPQTPVITEPKTPNAVSSTKKSSLKQWSDKFRHGFLSADQEEVRREEEVEAYMDDISTPEPPSTFPISLDPAYQARLQADVELLICVSANKFLLHEAQHGRISKDSVNKVRRAWESRNLPQVLEYHYDQGTQRELVLASFRTIRFQGQFANDPVALNSAMLSWGNLAKEMSVRTFCIADSAVKKQMHDAQRVLEMLGAPLVTCLAFEQLHVRALAAMTKRQKERWVRKQAESKGHARNVSNVSKCSRSQNGPYPRRDYSDASQWLPHHRRNLSEGDFGEIKGAEEETIEEKLRRMNTTPAPPPELMMRKATGAANAFVRSQNSSPSPSRYGHRYNRSMGGSSGRY